MMVTSFPRRALIFLIELYRTWISPTRLPSCRFEPTCSSYAVEAVTEWGAVRGSGLSIVRLLKCGPWHKPGYDPVPERSGHHGRRTVAPAAGPIDTNAPSGVHQSVPGAADHECV